MLEGRINQVPRVSVVIPTYNRAEYLVEAVESVLAQEYADYEVLIIDDGSTDNTPEVVQRFPAELIRYHRQRNAGPSAARNTGLDLARGELVAFLDSDDRWLPDKLGPQVALFDEFPELVLVAGNNQHFDTRGPIQRFHTDSDEYNELLQWEIRPSVFYVPEPLDLLLQKNRVPSGSVLARRDTILEVGGFDPDLHYGEDYDLWLRLSARGPFAFERRVVYLYRQHGETLSRDEFRRHRSKIRSLQKALAQQRLTFTQRQLLRHRIAGRYKMLGDLCMKNNDLGAARAEYAAALGTQIHPRALLLFLLSAFMSLNPFRTLPATPTGTSGASGPATNVEDSANGTR